MKRIFLLGGYDLEMLTIRDLLKEHKEIYYDEKLRWDNAVLSSYQRVLERYGDKEDSCLYGIELRPSSDMKVYANYRLIDHHNERSDEPAALIQVAKLLNHSLTRHEQLVAANDSLYIPGMIELGATKEEIENIRRQDRAAQGVTAEDEKLAEEAIKQNMEQIGDLKVVRSGTSRFSPIADRLYPCNKLLIYTDTEWMYYGEGVEEIIHLFRNKLGTNSFFHGGGATGFAGIEKGRCTEEAIKQMKNQIIETIINSK